MKKLMIAAAIICAAVAANAAMVDWKISGTSAFAGKTAYAFDNSNAKTVLDALAAGGTGIATTLSGLKNGSATVSSGARSNINGTSNPVNDGNIFFVIFDGPIQDGTTYTYSSNYDMSAKVYDPGEAGTTFTGNWSSAGTGTIGGAEPTPEPTSALLMLLGVAGLALKRKQK